MDKKTTTIDYASRELRTGKPEPADTTKASEVMDQDYYRNRPGLPHALAKACGDLYQYTLGLRDGTILFFESAYYVPGSGWIHLSGLTFDSVGASSKPLPFEFKCGMDVRLADITWAADGPWGS